MLSGRECFHQKIFAVPFQCDTLSVCQMYARQQQVILAHPMRAKWPLDPAHVINAAVVVQNLDILCNVSKAAPYCQ